MFSCKKLLGIEEPILIVSAYNELYGELQQASESSYRKYVSHFGKKYEYRAYQIPVDYDRPPSWFKIDLLIDICKEREGIVWWVDTDTVATKLSRLPVHNTQFNFCFSDVFNGINCGVFSIKCCKETFSLLEKIREQTQFLHHLWWEQAAVHYLYYETKELLPFSILQKNTIVNCFEMSHYGLSPESSGQITKDTIIAHFPGMSMAEKQFYMTRYSL